MELNYAPHLFNEYKTRNILSIADRVAVIREYDRHVTRPSLQSLASKFECSSKQIKNILVNRESILQSFQNGGLPHKEDSTRDDVLQKRQEKIAFLGKVMYEYIQRVLYFNCNIDDQKVIQKALQIKECIAVENFQPTNDWFEDFKMTYGIPAFDLQTLRNNVVITEAKRPHLSAIDMIQYVSRMDKEQQEEKRKLMPYSKSDINGNAKIQKASITVRNDPKIVYEVIDDDDDGEGEEEDEEEHDEELQKLKFNNVPAKTYSMANKRRPSSPYPDIESMDDALKHLKVLEDYAMLSDNFRAIGLLTQLEQVFKKQPKKK